MTIKQLEHFLAIARSKSFAKAAEELFISPSALSKSIAALEVDLGGQLFDRNSKAIALTPAGKVLYRDGPAMLNGFLDLEARARRAVQMEIPKISVLSANHHIFYVTRLYKRFVQEHPAVEWSLFKLPREEVAAIGEKILHREADMGILPEVELTEDTEELGKIILYRCPFVAVVGEDHPFSKVEEISIEQLAGMEILGVHYARREALNNINHLLAMQQLPPIRLSSCKRDDIGNGADDFVFLQVGAGRGISILPDISPHIYSYGCVAVPIRELYADENLFNLLLIYRKDNYNPSLLKFLEYAREAEESYKGGSR